jgi:pyruvate kinase
MGTLDAVIAALARLSETSLPPFPAEAVWREGADRLTAQRRAMFGSDSGATAIMVTMPSEAATDPDLVDRLVAAGMDCARINCAHDEPSDWIAMAKLVRAAAARQRRDCRILMDLPGPKCRIETLSPEKPDRVHVGDRLRLAASPRKAAGGIPTLTISFPDVVERLRSGAEVWIDDGKIRSRVVAVEDGHRILEVYGAREKGEKLRIAKGVNLPDFPLGLPALSAEDLAAVPTLVAHADMIGFSFVQQPHDIVDLDQAVSAASPGRPLMPLILKIETPEAVRNLPRLIVQAAGSRPTAVMIARGDLAVELGHARLAEVQEEILWLCEAARVPVIWATQVLDDLVKDGLPSRAETTDAAMAQRAECVMLNKGPHVVDAIAFLTDVFSRMSRHQSKKSARLGALNSWPIDTLAITP